MGSAEEVTHDTASPDSEAAQSSSDERASNPPSHGTEQMDVSHERAQNLTIEIELPNGWDYAMGRPMAGADDSEETAVYLWAFSGPVVDPDEPGAPPPLRPGTRGVLYVSATQPSSDIASKWDNSVQAVASAGYQSVDETRVAGNRAGLAIDERDDHASRTLVIEYQDRIVTVTSSYLEFDEILDIAETIELQPRTDQG